MHQIHLCSTDIVAFHDKLGIAGCFSSNTDITLLNKMLVAGILLLLDRSAELSAAYAIYLPQIYDVEQDQKCEAAPQ